MSTTVKVWNDNVHPHKEIFKGETIEIQPGGCVEMDYMEAIEFRGQFVTPKFDGSGRPDPRSFKKIRVDQPTTPIFRDDPNVMHATGQRLGTPAEAIAFAKAYAAMNPDSVAYDSEAEKSDKVMVSKAVMDDLTSRLAALEAKKPQGRPVGFSPKKAD